TLAAPAASARLGAPVEDVAVVAGEDDDAAGTARLAQDVAQRRELVHAPPGDRLDDVLQPLVDVVEHDPDHPTVAVGDGGEQVGGQRVEPAGPKVPLVEQHRLGTRRGARPEGAVGGEATALAPVVSPAEGAAQQRRAADLGDGGEGGDGDERLGRVG